MRYFDPIPWDDVHFQRQQELVARVQRLYDKAMREAVRLGVATNIRDFQKKFRFKDYPQLEKAINELIAQLQGGIVKTMEDAQTKSWEWANAKNDAFLAHVLGRRVADMPLRYFARNMAALGAFQQRKEAGLNLSDRVWKYSRQFKEEIEQALDVGLDGRPASAVARDVKKYLNEPDKRFRRIRDKHGTLKLSKNALSYHPGQGVYRSSYKNAERLARTEINMAYRTADHLRFQEFDFIVGFEVKRSGRGGACPVCDKLKGKYPKTFVFRSWHANCRCYVVSILSTEAEFESNLATSSTKSENEVKKPHAGWYEYLNANKDKIEKALNKPYFIGDNQRFVKYDKVDKKAGLIPKNITEYEKETGVKIDKSIFTYLKSSVPLKLKDPLGNNGAYYHSAEKYIHLPTNRSHYNKWKYESVVYHEYGHAIDFQNDLHTNPKVTELINKYKNADLQNASIKCDAVGYSSFEKKDYTSMYQAGALSDTIKSIDIRFGSGHSDSYFSRKGNSELEFIAHAFENKFIGNKVFKQIMPELYQDMITLLDDLLNF